MHSEKNGMHVFLFISHPIKKGRFCLMNYKMYVSVVDQKVHLHPDDSPWEYEVEVPQKYVPIFHTLFKQQAELEDINFLRSHLPFIPYLRAYGNEDIDLRTQKIYALIHEFTNQESQEFIEQLPYFR